MANTLSMAKACSITAYEPFTRVKSDERTWSWETDIYSVSSTTQAEHQFVEYAGLPLAQMRKEGEPVPYYDITELAAFRLTLVKYLIGTRFTYELVEDAIHIPGLMKEGASMVGESHRQVADIYANSPFDHAFSNTYPVDPVAETVALCGTHTLLDSTTQSNLITAAAPDTDTLLAELSTYQHRRKNHVGLLATDKAKLLMYSPEKMPAWRKILQNSVEPDTADRNDNFVSEYGLKGVVNPHLTTTTNWFLIGAKFKQDAIFKWRKKAKVDEPWDDKDFRAIKIPSESRFGLIIKDYLGIRGCVGI